MAGESFAAVQREAVVAARAAMGTRFEIVLPLDRRRESRDRTVTLAEDALDVVEELHARLSAHDPTSLISFLNREAARRSVPVDEDLFDLLAVCDRGWAATGGVFDAAWSGGVARAWERIELDAGRGTVRFLDDRVRLDLGGIAKGHALDVAGDVLARAGVRSAFLHGGTSSVRAIGGSPAGAPWGVGVRRGVGVGRIWLCDASLSVSRARVTRMDSDACEVGHIIDTRTGEPAAVAGCSGVVCADTQDAGAWAEIWSTALAVGVAEEHRPGPGLRGFVEMGDQARTFGGFEWPSHDPVRWEVA